MDFTERSGEYAAAEKHAALARGYLYDARMITAENVYKTLESLRKANEQLCAAIEALEEKCGTRVGKIVHSPAESPEDRLFIKEVEKLTKLTSSQIYKMRINGDFPTPLVAPGRAHCWKRSTIMEWLEANHVKESTA